MKSDRGFFGIGIFNGKCEQNIGTLWRSATILGASFIFTIGKRYRRQCSDTTNAPKHIPLYNYGTWDDFIEHIPYGCPVVGVELSERSIPLERYVHPKCCIYLLGAEDNGIPEKKLSQCLDVIQIPGKYCYNVSVAGSIVMYDRLAKVELSNEKGIAV